MPKYPRYSRNLQHDSASRMVSSGKFDIEPTREDRPERASGAVNHWGGGPPESGGGGSGPTGGPHRPSPRTPGSTWPTSPGALDGLEFPHLRGELRVFLGLGLDCIPAGSPCFKASPSEPCNACGPLPTLV